MVLIISVKEYKVKLELSETFFSYNWLERNFASYKIYHFQNSTGR